MPITRRCQLAVLAETDADGCIMAVAHHALPWPAAQFQSILSGAADYGVRLIRNIARRARANIHR